MVSIKIYCPFFIGGSRDFLWEALKKNVNLLAEVRVEGEEGSGADLRAQRCYQVCFIALKRNISRKYS